MRLGAGGGGGGGRGENKWGTWVQLPIPSPCKCNQLKIDGVISSTDKCNQLKIDGVISSTDKCNQLKIDGVISSTDNSCIQSPLNNSSFPCSPPPPPPPSSTARQARLVPTSLASPGRVTGGPVKVKVQTRRSRLGDDRCHQLPVTVTLTLTKDRLTTTFILCQP